MATTFDHDLLISYAHIDNQVLGTQQEGWISSLHRALEVRVSQSLEGRSESGETPSFKATTSNETQSQRCWNKSPTCSNR